MTRKAPLWRDLAQCAALCLALGVMPYCAQGTATERAQETARRLNRAAHPAPKLPANLSQLAHFPAAFDRWFADAFGGRAALVAARSQLAVLALADSPVPTLLVGPNRWIFAREQLGLEAARGLSLLSTNELARWSSSLEARRVWLEERGIAYAVVFAPEKASIYPGELPARLPFRGPSRLERALEHIHRHTGAFVPDVAAEMHELRDQAPYAAFLYTPTGVHWRARGAYAAYRTLTPFFQRLWSDFVPWSDSEFELVKTIDTSDSWAFRLSLGRSLFDEEWVLRPIRSREAIRRATVGSGNSLDSSYECASAPERRALVLHDSFGPELLPFLAEHFRSLEARRSIDFDLQLIEALQPDIVLQVYSEHALVAQRPDRSVGLAQADLEPRFRKAEDVVLEVSRSAELPRHATSGAADLVDGPLGMSVSIEGPTALFELPTPARPRLGERWVVGVELTTPGPERVALFFLEPGDTTIDRKRVYVAEVAGPRQWALFELGPRVRPDGLVLGFGRSADGTVVHGIEVRRIEMRD